MKKLVVIGLTALTVGCTAPSLDAFAQSKVITVPGQKCVVNQSCDLTELKDCIESGSLPGSCLKWGIIKFNKFCQSGSETPDVNTDTNCGTVVPEVNPDTNCGTQTPDIDTELPEIIVPDTNGSEDEVQPDNGTTEEQPSVSIPEASDYATQVVELVNMERAKEGLSPLTIDVAITTAATVRANEIQTSFSHTRPNGTQFSTALKEAGAQYTMAGENIAWGQKTPEAVVTAWMNSPGHRANIMNANFTRIGVGHVKNAAGTSYWVQLFAR